MLPGVKVSRVEEEEEVRGAWARALSRVLGGPSPHALLLSASSSSSSPPSGTEENRQELRKGLAMQGMCMRVVATRLLCLFILHPSNTGTFKGRKC